ncbi:hypothetical protein [Arthrobacter sp. LAR12-1-1.1]|uniref:hypothetical protein n=1 Tax=Arthrobacter sp. LAR12-1-1.1 TaxID=3135215 RepID=UPI003413DAB6
MSSADAALMAEAAHVEAIVKETQTPAEHVVDHLQETRSNEAQLSPAQERAERMAALARKVRENRAKTNKPDDAITSTPEAVKEALEQIKARRAEEQTRYEETRQGGEKEVRHDRGPGIGL